MRVRLGDCSFCFGITPEQLTNQSDKTRALCRALSQYVANDKSDRDRSYQVIQSLAKERGRGVHAGREPNVQDVLQAINFAKVAFSKSISDEKSPELYEH